MRNIVPNVFWLGNFTDVRDPARLYDVGIRAVVDIAYEELPAQLPRDFIYCRFPLQDGEGNQPETIRAAVATVVQLLRLSIPTLIGCSAGMSRSPTIAAFAMAECYDDTPERYLAEIVAAGPHDVSPALWRDVAGAMMR